MAALAELLTDYGPNFVPVREDRLSFRGLPLPVVLRLPCPMSDVQLVAFSRENKLFCIESNADGDLEITSPVGYEVSRREMFVGATLYLWARENGGVAMGPNVGFKLDAVSVRSPDAAWISKERAAGMSIGEKRGFPRFAPDFLIEVRSETDSRRVLLKKMELWMDSGVRLAWMIDPYDADIMIYRPDVEPERLVRPEWVEADSVVTGFRLETAQMWELA